MAKPCGLVVGMYDPDLHPGTDEEVVRTTRASCIRQVDGESAWGFPHALFCCCAPPLSAFLADPRRRRFTTVSRGKPLFYHHLSIRVGGSGHSFVSPVGGLRQFQGRNRRSRPPLPIRVGGSEHSFVSPVGGLRQFQGGNRLSTSSYLSVGGLRQFLVSGRGGLRQFLVSGRTCREQQRFTS
jgi:hypothetical protein